MINDFYKLTTTGGLQLTSTRSREAMQVALLGYVGKMDLFVRWMHEPYWVLSFDRDGTPSLTEHGNPRNMDHDFIPGWVYPFTQALSLVTSAKEPSHD